MKQRAKSQKVFEKILDFFARKCYNGVIAGDGENEKEESRMIHFVAGMAVGAVIGVFAIALASAGKDDGGDGK